jgi:hypothetical protein
MSDQENEMMITRFALAAAAAIFVAGSAATGFAQGHGQAGGMSASTVGTGAGTVSPGGASGVVGSGGSAAAGGTSASSLGLGAESTTPNQSSSALGTGGSAASAKSHTVTHLHHGDLSSRTKSMAHEPGGPPVKSTIGSSVDPITRRQ